MRWNMKKLDFKFLVVSFLLTILLNSLFIVVVAFKTEEETNTLPNKLVFNDIFNYNSENNIEDYYLLNWAYGKEGCLSCSELPKQVVGSNLTRLTRTENIIINFLQSKNNSLIQIKPYKLIPFNTYDIDTKNNSFVNSVKVVDIFNSFYVIIGFTEYIDSEVKLTSAVYKSEDDLSDLYEFETEKEHYYFYEFYPNELAPLFSSTFDKILNVLFVIGEVAVVYFVLVRRTRQGQDKGTTGTNQGTVL